jgi:TIR domain
MRRQIFISYAREDQTVAEKLYDILDSFSGVKVWLDVRDLLPGADWREDITKAIERSDAIILLLSDSSINKAGYVQREIRDAIERLSLQPPGERLIIPVRISPCEPRHRVLAQLHWVDLFPAWQPGLSKLLVGLGLSDALHPRLRFTHKYVVLGELKIDGYSRIVPWDTEIAEITENKLRVMSAVPLPVSYDRLPPFDESLVYREPLPRAGIARDVFIRLWDAAVGWGPLYRKHDWNDFDGAVFSLSRRDQQTVAVITQAFARLWPAARQLTEYSEADWRILYSLVFKQMPSGS